MIKTRVGAPSKGFHWVGEKALAWNEGVEFLIKCSEFWILKFHKRLQKVEE